MTDLSELRAQIDRVVRGPVAQYAENIGSNNTDEAGNAIITITDAVVDEVLAPLIAKHAQATAEIERLTRAFDIAKAEFDSATRALHGDLEEAKAAAESWRDSAIGFDREVTELRTAEHIDGPTFQILMDVARAHYTVVIDVGDDEGREGLRFEVRCSCGVEPQTFDDITLVQAWDVARLHQVAQAIHALDGAGLLVKATS